MTDKQFVKKKYPFAYLEHMSNVCYIVKKEWYNIWTQQLDTTNKDNNESRKKLAVGRTPTEAWKNAKKEINAHVQ